jgi:hypothetical protein
VIRVPPRVALDRGLSVSQLSPSSPQSTHHSFCLAFSVCGGHGPPGIRAPPRPASAAHATLAARPTPTRPAPMGLPRAPPPMHGWIDRSRVLIIFLKQISTNHQQNERIVLFDTTSQVVWTAGHPLMDGWMDARGQFRFPCCTYVWSL